jgi:hypothetical protein
MEFRIAGNTLEDDCLQLVGDALKMTDLLGFKVLHSDFKG